MTGRRYILSAMAMTFLIAGCSPFMVPLREIDGLHPIGGALTEEQVRAAIIQGAELSGWRAKELGDGQILASYTHKNHVVHVKIEYTDTYYSIHYRSSNEMKMFCSESDKTKHQNMKVSGRQNCPGNSSPAYIHKAYKQWMDSLNFGIAEALASA